jgi:hypothetical membrane protein
MKNSFYIISAISCTVLASLSYSRKNYIGMIIAVLISLFYLYKLIVIGRREKKAEINEIKIQPVKSSKKREEIHSELLLARNKMKINRNKIIGFMIMDIIVSVFVYFLNPSTGIAFSLLLLPLGFLVYRNMKGIRLIENGLDLKNN